MRGYPKKLRGLNNIVIKSVENPYNLASKFTLKSPQFAIPYTLKISSLPLSTGACTLWHPKKAER